MIKYFKKGVVPVKRNLKTGSAILLCAFTILFCTLSVVSFSQNSDPLVTLSYLTDIILPQMKKDIIAEVSIKAPADADNGDTQPLPEQTTQEEITQNINTYTLLELDKDKTIYTRTALEFIVRPGSEVHTISPFEDQGIADITNGKEYLNGDVIEHNAYCLIPRGSDGRGFKVISEKAYIFVRGEYYID